MSNFSKDLLDRSISGYELRQKYPENPTAQGKEHGDFAEYLINENKDLTPLLAPALAMAIPLYQVAKISALGRHLVKISDKPASKPSIEQMKGGYEGLGRGLEKYLSTQFLDFMGIKVDEKKAPNQLR